MAQDIYTASDNNKTKICSDIDSHLSLLQSSIKWADEFHVGDFPVKEFKEYRRIAKRINEALKYRCSVAAYGESQVGKSYLMGSLLSSNDCPFVITNGGKEYNFVNDINPSGGRISKIESTGVITRFTTQDEGERQCDGRVKVQNLSVADIIMMILDSYYSDVTIDAKGSLSPQIINERLDEIMNSLRNSAPSRQTVLTEDDVFDIYDYTFNIIGNNANNVLLSDFFKTVSEYIETIPYGSWCKVFELTWNCNPNFSRLFTTLVSEYSKISFKTDVYIPFDALLNDNGTLLQVQWLDLVCGNEQKEVNLPVLTTDVYAPDGSLLAKDFQKTYLSTFAAEVTFVLPESIATQHPFLQKLDLLDFPGARNRLDRIENDLDYVKDMPEILRRGKVAYLFNKYVITKRISSIMFCHHNDQKSANLGNTIKRWVEDEIGKTPKERTEHLRDTDNVSPLLIVATKFNLDMTKSDKDTAEKLTEHWGRFSFVLPEIFGSYNWFGKWSERGGTTVPFQSIYPLRDFKWSSCAPGKSCLFEGYDDKAKTPETAQCTPKDCPNYFDMLYQSFAANIEVQRHFGDIKKTWDSVATVQHDGSEPIREALGRLAPKLDEARTSRFLVQLKTLRDNVYKALDAQYVPQDEESNSVKTKEKAYKIRVRLIMAVGSNPQVFGKIIDSLMIMPEEFRKIAKDIIIRKIEIPTDFTEIAFIRAEAGIDPKDGEEVNMKKLLRFHGVDTPEELAADYADKEYGVEDIINGTHEFCATVSDVLAKHIMQCWKEHLNKSVSMLAKYLPYADDIVKMFQTLATILKVREKLSEDMSRYDKMFEDNERLNAIADYASLELNNFVTTVGRKYMSEENIKKINDKAEKYEIEVDLSPEGIEPSRRRQPLEEALVALEESTDIMRKPGFNSDDMVTLRRLPLWDNFQRWQNLLLVGLILASQESTADPRKNKAVEELMNETKKLYE